MEAAGWVAQGGKVAAGAAIVGTLADDSPEAREVVVVGLHLVFVVEEVGRSVSGSAEEAFVGEREVSVNSMATGLALARRSRCRRKGYEMTPLAAAVVGL